MRTLLSMALLAALTTLAGCGDRGAPAAPPVEEPAVASTASETPAPIEGNTSGSLRVDAPAEGTITFKGFGPANFGATQEDVRMA